MVNALPQILKGKSVDEVHRTMFQMLIGYGLLSVGTVVIGLMVWYKVFNKRK